MTDAPQPHEVAQPAPTAERRTVLQWILGGFLVAVGATFLGPVAAYLSPRRPKGGKQVLMDDKGRSVAVKDLEGKSYIVGLGIDGEPTIVMRHAGELKAFTAVCTHLGCIVIWLAAKNEFFCPCHSGKFDANGVNIAGPPPAPLKRFRASETADGFIGLERVNG